MTASDRLAAYHLRGRHTHTAGAHRPNLREQVRDEFRVARTPSGAVRGPTDRRFALDARIARAQRVVVPLVSCVVRAVPRH